MIQLTSSVIQHHAVSSVERSGVGTNGADSSCHHSYRCWD